MGKRRGGEGGRGAEAFRAHYSAVYGERWPALEAALETEPDSVAFAAAEGAVPYFLDSASVFAASCLELPPGGALAGGGSLPDAAGDASAGGVHSPATGAVGAGARILDACAAPGGKSLVLASRLPPGYRLVANELSADRRRRLRDVLDTHLPPELRTRVELSGRDAASMCRSNESRFDAILLDAPCSSERHLLRQSLARPGGSGQIGGSALAEWSPARSRHLAARQWALLSSALIMLKAGGSLVYATCALSPQENDGVVERALGKYGPAIAIAGTELPITGTELPEGAEATKYGMAILPDRTRGAGPIYVCRLKKIG